jgi:hypothetical protein
MGVREGFFSSPRLAARPEFYFGVDTQNKLVNAFSLPLPLPLCSFFKPQLTVKPEAAEECIDWSRHRSASAGSLQGIL